jgi:ATP-binding cassette subfamily F protein uup
MAPPPILVLRDIHLTFGRTALLEGAEFSVLPGDRLCLVGRNGSGKSTLLKIVAGQVEADRGERFVQPGATLRYLAQEPDLTGYPNALAYVEGGMMPGDDPYRAAYLLEQLGLTGAEDLSRLSGGEARRCALARALAPSPDILLLDEPTNHLDLPTIEWLETELKSMRSAQVLISHDRRFLEDLSRTTLWLSQGRTLRLDKGFGAFEEWRDDILEREEVERHKLDRKIASETEWLRKGVTARRKRNQGRLRALGSLREQRRTQRGPTGSVRMTAADPTLSGKLVVECENISKSYGERAIVKNFSTRILRGDRVGIVGPNGAGKTTLLSMLVGTLEPDEGRIRRGTNLEMVTIDQKRETLDPSETLQSALVNGAGDQVYINGEPKHVMGYMKDFLFLPEQARTPVTALSGGERGRLLLARALARSANLLVLDEPTNDLDLETLDLLQELLADFPGTVLLVSHDRDFLDRVAVSTIAYEGRGRWIEYAGGYSDMLMQRGRDLDTTSQSASRASDKPSGSKPSEPPKASAAGAAARGRLSFKDKHALEALPKRIAELEAEIGRLKKVLADPGLYARDPKAFAAAADALTAADMARASAEDEWLALEMKREEVEGA